MTEEAIAYVKKVFGDRKENDELYINHMLRVADRMDTEVEKTVALLHDVLEDTELMPYDLKEAGFPADVVEMVTQLTRKNDFTYFEYIEDVATNPVCKKVKLAELDDNEDVVRVNKLSFRTFSLSDRCEKARAILNSVC